MGRIETLALVRAFLDRVRGVAPITRAIAFGSRTRGDNLVGSDLDLLVIEPSVKDRVQEMVRLRRALRPVDSAIDLLVASEHHVEEWGHLRNTVIGEALSEGRILHGAS
jgi:predicted nucleotidyltransferase